MPTYRVEEASTGRAGCKNKECLDGKVKIAKGELRLGSWIEAGTFQSWAWKHWYVGCVTPRQIASIRETLGDSLDMDLLDGYEELSEENQEKVCLAIDNGHVDDDDWKGDPELNRPGKSGFRVRKKKARPGPEDKDEDENSDS
ncbi:hypothetical protein KEM52_001350 [Ascosphaera acerosa]|nr:hypothetical protein KEM52_001350 [Ascosphaera acerosa]